MALVPTYPCNQLALLSPTCFCRTNVGHYLSSKTALVQLSQVANFCERRFFSVYWWSVVFANTMKIKEQHVRAFCEKTACCISVKKEECRFNDATVKRRWHYRKAKQLKLRCWGLLSCRTVCDLWQWDWACGTRLKNLWLYTETSLWSAE
jgi:hypothetical protein